MHTSLLVLVCYLCVNFCCALLFHLHGLRQAHLPPRFLDVLMHFVLFSALAIPLLIVICSEAFFGREQRVSGTGYRPVAQHH